MLKFWKALSALMVLVMVAGLAPILVQALPGPVQAADGWVIQTVDSAGSAGFSSLALDSGGHPHISYRGWTGPYLKYASDNGTGWNLQGVDSAGVWDFSLSLAMDSDDKPCIAYTNCVPDNSTLKYASDNGTGWNIETVDAAGDVGAFPSLAIDSDDHPHISYCGYGQYGGDVKYASYDGTDWHTETVDSGGKYTSLALDSDGHPHISYMDWMNGDLKYASDNGTAWNIETVDPDGMTGYCTSLALDPSDNPRISYVDGNPNFDLKYASDNGTDWNIETVDSSGMINETSLALDSSNHPHISYREINNQYLKYASDNGTDWNIETVDPAVDVGVNPSLALDSFDHPHISYYDQITDVVKYAHLVSDVVTVTGVNPARGYCGQTLDVVITGTNFSGATSVSLGAGITANPFTVDNSTQITASITIAAGATPGLRDVSVTTAGTGTLTNGFNILAAPTGKIAFASGRDSNMEIYVMNADGSGQTRLTNNPAADEYPAWSPDGTKIAFDSNRDGNREIYVMNADGSGQTRITNNTSYDANPAWSPDGAKITFRSDRDGNGQIYIMNADGSGQTRLTSNAAYDKYPKWSPDGTKIAFDSNRLGEDEIYVMSATDGSGQTNISNDPGGDLYPAWSPDGTKIVFYSTRDGNIEIYRMNASDGSGQTRLTNNPASDAYPAWSPDGTMITFQSDRDGNREIYVMNADGSGQVNISNNAADDRYPVWSAGPSPFVPPTVDHASTNAAGTFISITFSKNMADPTGKQASFSYKINNGTAQPFASAALNTGSATIIALRGSGTVIAEGDNVTVSYTAGTVTAADGGVLASFSDRAVYNNVPAQVPTITLTSVPATIVANGTSTSILTATVRDQYGNPVPDGTPVHFTTSKGTISDNTTTNGGSATATLTSIVSSETLIADVSAACNSATKMIAVFFTRSSQYPITDIQTETLTGSGTVTNTAAGVSVTVNGTGSYTITTANYGPSSFNIPGFLAYDSGFCDVHLDNTDNVTSIAIRFSPAYPSTIIYYHLWGGAWRSASNQIYSNGVITVTVTATTFPSLSDLCGLIFGTVTPTPQPVQAAPTSQQFQNTPVPLQLTTPPHGGTMPGVTQNPPPVALANLIVQKASLSSTTVGPNTPVTVTADLTNRSTVNSTKKVTLYVNGQIETDQAVTVSSGGSSKLTFNIARSEPGDYSVYVDGVPAGSFKVELVTGNDAILIFSFTMLSMAFVVGLVMLWRRQQRGY